MVTRRLLITLLFTLLMLLMVSCSEDTEKSPEDQELPTGVVSGSDVVSDSSATVTAVSSDDTSGQAWVEDPKNLDPIPNTKNNPANVGDVMLCRRYSVTRGDYINVKIKVTSILHDQEVIAKGINLYNEAYPNKAIEDIDDGLEWAVATVAMIAEDTVSRRLPALIYGEAPEENYQGIYETKLINTDTSKWVEPNEQATVYILYRVPQNRCNYALAFGESVDDLAFVKGA